MFKVNKKYIRAKCEIFSKLIIKTPEWRQLRRSGVFIVNSEQISKLVLVFLVLTLSRKMPAGTPNLAKSNLSLIVSNAFDRSIN